MYKVIHFNGRLITLFRHSPFLFRDSIPEKKLLSSLSLFFCVTIFLPSFCEIHSQSLTKSIPLREAELSRTCCLKEQSEHNLSWVKGTGILSNRSWRIGETCELCFLWCSTFGHRT